MPPIVVPLALILSSGLLAAGLSLPLLQTEQLLFWKSTYSVWTGVVSLWMQREYVLATILFTFSMVFPILKLAALTCIWFGPMRRAERERWLHWLGVLGKWSMLDVFIVAILIVVVKIGPLAKVNPRPGVYIFAAAIACSMLTTMLIERSLPSGNRPTTLS